MSFYDTARRLLLKLWSKCKCQIVLEYCKVEDKNAALHFSNNGAVYRGKSINSTPFKT